MHFIFVHWERICGIVKRNKSFPFPSFHLQYILICHLNMLFLYWQTESAGIQRAQIQKELWRIQDVMEGLSKHKQQRSSSDGGKLVVFNS